MSKLKPYPHKCPFCASNQLFWPWLSPENGGGMGCVKCHRPFVSDEGCEILGVREEPIPNGGIFGGIAGVIKSYIYGEKVYEPRGRE